MTAASDQPIRSSEEVAEELMKHCLVIVAVGLDATKRRVIKLSKVVFRNSIKYEKALLQK